MTDSELQKWFDRPMKPSFKRMLGALGEFRLRQWFDYFKFHHDSWMLEWVLQAFEKGKPKTELPNTESEMWAEEALVFLGEKKCKDLLQKWWEEK